MFRDIESKAGVAKAYGRGQCDWAGRQEKVFVFHVKGLDLILKAGGVLKEFKRGSDGISCAVFKTYSGIIERD